MYTSKNQAFVKNEQYYGSYTISNLINGRAYYKKDEGAYGIWWCDTRNFWCIGLDSSKGQCAGYVFSREIDQCVHDVGNSWEYFDSSSTNDRKWFKAGEGLMVSCLKSGKYISNG